MSKGNHNVKDAWMTAMVVSNVLTSNNVMHAVCGSLRRGVKGSIGDIDIAVRSIPQTIEVLKLLGADIILPQKSKFSTPMNIDAVIDGIKVNIYQAAASNWGAMLLFLTGSGLFNIKMRVYAKAHGMKLNQYGLWRGDELLAAKTEHAIFLALGLKTILPEHREWAENQSLWNLKFNKRGRR